MKKVRIGVVGCGTMGKHHARILSGLKESSLVGVFDIDPSLAASIADQNKTRAYGDLESLLADTEAVVLSTPTSTHHDLGLACLGSSTHLLIEKPLALSSSDGLDLVSLSIKKKLILCVGMVERFNPAYISLKRYLKSDRLLGITFERYSPFPERIFDADVVMDMMIHDLDLALDLSLAPLDSIKASGSKVRSSGLDDVQATLYFSDGLIAKVSACRVKDSQVRLISATTNKAIYEADLLSKKLYRRSFEDLSSRQELEVKAADQLSQELRDFLLAIRKERSPQVNGEQGLRSLKAAEEVSKLCS